MRFYLSPLRGKREDEFLCSKYKVFPLCVSILETQGSSRGLTFLLDFRKIIP